MNRSVVYQLNRLLWEEMQVARLRRVWLVQCVQCLCPPSSGFLSGGMTLKPMRTGRQGEAVGPAVHVIREFSVFACGRSVRVIFEMLVKAPRVVSSLEVTVLAQFLAL